MTVIAILGSRDPQGQTARAAQALLEGSTSQGSQGQQVFLPEMKIERCRQCNQDGSGICSRQGHCVIEDDFASIVEQLKRASAAVFATPVYFGDLSESMRAFLDRLGRTCGGGEPGHERILGKPAMGICVAGGQGGGAPACTLSLEKYLTRCGFDVVDMVPVRRQNLDLKLTTLRTTGQWLVNCTDNV